MWSAPGCCWIGSYETAHGEGRTGNGRSRHQGSPFPVRRAPCAPTQPAPSSRALADPEPERPLTLPWVFAITGASGAPYGVRLLEFLAKGKVPVQLIVSRHGWRILELESGISSDTELKKATGGDWSTVSVFDDADRGATPASGSAKSAGMVIAPCSMGTVSAVAQGSSRSLVERAADVALKERRKLILVPRETPLSLIHLRNLTTVTEAGGVVIPAAPGFYHKPKAISDLVDFVVQRVLDQMGLSIEIAPRWK